MWMNNVQRVVRLLQKQLPTDSANVATVICLNEVTMPRSRERHHYQPLSRQKLVKFVVEHTQGSLTSSSSLCDSGSGTDSVVPIKQFHLLVCECDSEEFVHELICHHMMQLQQSMPQRGGYTVTPCSALSASGYHGQQIPPPPPPPLDSVTFQTLQDGHTYTIKQLEESEQQRLKKKRRKSSPSTFLEHFSADNGGSLFQPDRYHSLKHVAQALGCYFTFGPTCSIDTFGNAILSRQKIESVKNMTAPYEEQRSFLHVTFDRRERLSTCLPGGVICTHLDHICENERLKEWNWACNNDALADPSQPHIVCGDFNALCPYDYTASRLQEIQQHRTDNRWEQCKFQLYETVTKDHGYMDCYLLRHGHQTNPSTSRFDTRIDYIFLHAGREVNPDVSLLECIRCDILEDERHTSDHLPVLAEFQINDGSENAIL